MKIQSLLACASILVFTNTLAQGQADVQGGASANAQGTVSADRQRANATTSAAGSGSTSARAADQEVSAALAGGSEMNATLTKPLDAKKTKPNDEVTATVAQDVKSNGQVVIPRGSKLIGHVTEAKAHSKGSASGNAAGNASGAASAAADTSSRLGVVFDRAVLKNGREVPLNATIQALAAASGSVSGAASDMTGAAAERRPDGGGLLGGVSNTAGGTLGTTGSIGGPATGTVGSTVRGATHASAGALGGLNAAGGLTSGSRGVFNMKGLDIQSATTGNAQGSVITSATRNVRLEAGTQMLLTTSTNTANSSSSRPPDVDHR